MPERDEHDGRVEQHRAEDQRLHVAGAVALDVGDEEADPRDQRGRRTAGRAIVMKTLQRLVLRVDARDRDRVAAHVRGHRREQARLARLRVRPDRDVVGRDEQLARLDDRLERVGVLRDDRDLDRRLAVVRAEAGRRVGHVGVRGLAHDPRAEPSAGASSAARSARSCRSRGRRRRGRRGPRRSGATSFGMSGRMYWLSASVLTITSAPSFRHASSPAWKPAARPLLFVSLHDVVDAVGAGDLDRAVGGAVVDDEPLDDVDARDLAREVGERRRERGLLVEAGNLDDELHGEPSRARGVRRMSDTRTGYGVRQAGPPATPPRTLGRPRSFDAWLARRSPGRDRASPRPRPAAGAPCPGPPSPSPGSSSARRSASSSGRRSPTTTATTRCSGAARCCTGRCRASTPTARRPSTRSRSPSARCSSLVGDDADRIMVGATFASFVILAAGMYRLARGVVHDRRRARRRRAALHALRLPVPRRPRVHRHPVPRAGRLGGRARGRAPAPRDARLRAARRGRPAAPGGMAAQRAVLPVVHPARDLAAAHPLRGADRHRRRSSGARWTGSSPATRCSRSPTRPAWPRSSGATRGLSEIPAATVEFLKSLDKVPVFYAGLLGLVLALVLVPRRVGWPLGMFVIGMATFVLVGLAGLSVIDRYLLVPSLMVMIFAAVTLGGFTMLRAGKLRTAWAVGAVAVVAYGAVFTATHVRFSVFDNELDVPRPVARLPRGAVPQPEGPRRAASAGRCRCRTTSSSRTRAGCSTRASTT